jgi:hypothetical protein
MNIQTYLCACHGHTSDRVRAATDLKAAYKYADQRGLQHGSIVAVVKQGDQVGLSWVKVFCDGMYVEPA